jgi:hypothetical protein
MGDDEKKYLSATALAKKYKISSKEMFVYLINHGLVEKRGEVWSLTNEGISAGGKFVKGKPFGKYIVWPEDLTLDINSEKLITVSAIAKHFSLREDDVLDILLKIGCIHIGPAGQDVGGLQDEDAKKGETIVRWPESIVDFDLLRSEAVKLGGKIWEKRQKQVLKKTHCSAVYRTDDGHFVNTHVEAVVDNWLFRNGIVHAYEKCHKEGTESSIISTFFLPLQCVCIDLELSKMNKGDLDQQEKRRKFYAEKELDFIELNEKQALNADNVLPGLLLNDDTKE